MGIIDKILIILYNCSADVIRKFSNYSYLWNNIIRCPWAPNILKSNAFILTISLPPDPSAKEKKCFLLLDYSIDRRRQYIPPPWGPRFVLYGICDRKKKRSSNKTFRILTAGSLHIIYFIMCENNSTADYRVPCNRTRHIRLL